MQIAGQRRRSTFNGKDKTPKEEEIAAVAQNLATRRDSVTPAPSSDDVATAAADSAGASAVVGLSVCLFALLLHPGFVALFSTLPNKQLPFQSSHTCDGPLSSRAATTQPQLPYYSIYTLL